MIGVILGIVIGLVIMPHLNTLLTLVGDIANIYMSFINRICNLFVNLDPPAKIEIFASDFYLDKIYTDIHYVELLVVSFITLHCALLASVIPALKTNGIKPNEVIKNG
jgi:ABC-type lipoprotein release transport system permease subunit